MSLFRRMRLRYLIMIVVGGIVTIGLVVTANLYSQRQEESIRRQNEQTMQKLAESVAQGLRSVMVTGSADMAQSYAGHLKEMREILGMRLLRITGEEAFLDNKTIDEVNLRRGEEAFPPRETEQVVQVLQPDDPHLVRAVSEQQPVSIYERDRNGDPVLSFLMPIVNDKPCFKCHSKTKPLRGVMFLSTSLAEVEREVLQIRQRAMILLVFAVVGTLALTGYLTGRTVVTPLEAVTRGMDRVTAGDLDHRVDVTANDELGHMANSFNLMTAELKNTHDDIRRESDKLTTVIQGASEGIAIADRSHNIVLINPALEEMLGRQATALIGTPVHELLGDPVTMAGWLSADTLSAPVTLSYGARTFQVMASRFLDDAGATAASAVLLREITEEKRLEEELRRLSTTDALTGLFNRRHLDNTLEIEFLRSQQNVGTPLAIVMFDIDHFKKFNDTHGHDQGDRVLQSVAQALREAMRQQDVPCRYGGEEFLAILPQTPLQGAMVVAERLRQDVEALVIDGLKVTISLGVASTPEIDAETPSALVERADAALYRSKEGGRNRVTCAINGEAAL